MSSLLIDALISIDFLRSQTELKESFSSDEEELYIAYLWGSNFDFLFKRPVYFTLPIITPGSPCTL